LPYFTISPVFSVCPIHGYIAGEHFYCPKCDSENGIVRDSERNIIKKQSELKQNIQIKN